MDEVDVVHREAAPVGGGLQEADGVEPQEAVVDSELREAVPVVEDAVSREVEEVRQQEVASEDDSKAFDRTVPHLRFFHRVGLRRSPPAHHLVPTLEEYEFCACSGDFGVLMYGVRGHISSSSVVPVVLCKFIVQYRTMLVECKLQNSPPIRIIYSPESESVSRAGPDFTSYSSVCIILQSLTGCHWMRPNVILIGVRQAPVHPPHPIFRGLRLGAPKS